MTTATTDWEKESVTCPVCDSTFVGSCRCMLSERLCQNNHTWIACDKHKRTIQIPNDLNLHSIDHTEFNCACELQKEKQ